MKQLLSSTLLVLLLLAACGGGGSGSPDPDEPDPPTEPSNPAIVEQVFEECVPAHLTEILDGLAVFQGFIEPGAETPPFDITGSNPAGGTIDYGLNLDDDMVFDFVGRIAMQNANGSPINLVPIFLSLGQDATVEEVLDALPDDARIVTTFDGRLPRDPPSPDPIELSGTIVTQSVPGPGLPDLISGDVESTNVACRMRVVFEDITLEDLLYDPTTDTYPTGVFDVEIENATDTLVGDVTFDGTKVAQVSIAQQGFLPIEYTYDLETEVLIPVP